MIPDDAWLFHEANVARVAKGSEGKCAVLIEKSMGYLQVRVLFHGAPVVGLKVEFGKIDGPGDDSPTTIKPPAVTNEDGVALFPRLVVAGVYHCLIDRQPTTIVPTVATLDAPYPVVLPIGRPRVDFGDVDEFTFRASE